MVAAALRDVSSRMARMTVLTFMGTLCVVLLVYEALYVSTGNRPSMPGVMWAWFATYALIGALFYVVGALVWLYGYARQRMVASLLFSFCMLLMLAFVSLSGAARGDRFSNALGSSTSALAVFCLFLLVLRFPRNLLPSTPEKRRVLDLLQVAVGLLSLLSASSSILNDIFRWTPPKWWLFLGGGYYGIVGFLIMGMIVLAMRTSASLRTLQQTRLFFAGTLLSFVPILIVTIIPTLFHLEAGIDGTRSMIFLVFFPIAMVYSLLRYELLVFDRYVRQIVTWVIGGVGIVLLGYLLFAISSQMLGSNAPLLLALLISAGVLASPYVWWLARRLTERYFFPETAYYATRLQEIHARQGLETFDLQLATHQLLLEIITILQSPAACFFVLDEERHCFRLVSMPQRETGGEHAQASLLAALDPLLSSLSKGTVRDISEAEPLLSPLSNSPRPLFLSEVMEGARTKVPGLAYYLTNRPSETAPDPLLAPMKTAQGKLIGIITLGERGDDQRYAGPEVEALQHMIDRATSPVEIARLYELTTRQQEASRYELEQAYAQQRVLNEQKDQFIIHVSHELRTPLSEVAGYLDLLAETGEELDPELRTVFVKKAQHGSEELQRLVETILNATQSSFTSPFPLQIEAVELAPIIQEVLQHLEPQTARDHAIEVQSVEGLRVFADSHALKLILENLVSNALKYTPTGTPITLRAQGSLQEDVEGPMVCLQVQDKGPGIPPAEASILFEKFARLERDRSGSIRGTGLGLYISKQLVESMGGSIWLESSGIEGKGSLFCFTLRQAQASTHPVRPAENVLV